MASTISQPDGVASVNASQTIPPTQTTSNTNQPSTQNTAGAGAAAAAASAGTTGASTNPSTSTSTRPRDARLIELLLTSQGVTAYEQRVPLLLMDFAYRHTSSILSDALHLSGDPYVTQAGLKPSASSGATAYAAGDASVSANAVKLAIGARLSYQFRGGSGGGGISKEYMQELARERNKVALPKIVSNEWGVRLPSERFVLSGTSWGLKDMWEEEADDSDDSDENMGEPKEQQAEGDAMEGVEGPEMDEETGDPVEGGTAEDIFGDDVDKEMEE